MAPRSGRFHVVLLAGGSGTRFWPLSRARRPKQFLALTGKRPMIVETWQRARKLAPASRIWVAAPRALADDVRECLPGLDDSRLVLEPSPRDTGPAVALACSAVAAKDPEAVVGIFPTDHVIRDTDEFVRCVRVAESSAHDGGLVCLGIRPDRPATGFGYLRCARKPKGRAAVPVARFVEKPDAARARRFLRSGQYLWNAGMFVWGVRRFFEELDRTAPEVSRAVRSGARGWRHAPKLSIDYAVMEKARGVEVVPLDAGWDDVGSWDAAARVREEAGLTERRQILVDSPGSSVIGEGRCVAIVDVPGVVVVDTPDALLVVSREGSEKVRQVVEELRDGRRKDLL